MTKPTFLETIKIKDGKLCNLPVHISRMNKTCRHFFNKNIEVTLSVEAMPDALRAGLVKCRVIYSDQIVDIDFSPYSFRDIQSISIAHADNISYPYKSTDRNVLNDLLGQSDYDEIIIVKNGYVTDTSFSNLVFEDDNGDLYTPDTYLLPGTKREYLLKNGILSERTITIDDLKLYSKVYLINAMIDIEDNICISTDRIKLL